jgi:hypothetical protein
MGFRIGVGAAIAGAAILLAVASGPTGSANAAATDLSFNEITRIVYGASPEPGSYKNGSFDADFAAATKKQAHGLFAAVQNAMSAINNGFASTYYYLDNMERQDDLRENTGTITMPDKHQIIHLDFNNKTYYIETPSPQQLQGGAPTMPPMTPQPQQSQAPPQPGTEKVTITASTTSLGSKNLGGVDADGYQVTLKIVATDATGSCKNGTFGTSIIEFVSSYPEPQLRYPKPVGMAPRPLNTMAPEEMMAAPPGCKPKVTARLHSGPVAPEGRLVVWEQLTLNFSANGQQAGAGSVIERGDIKQLGSGDSGLFGPPAGFTQQQPPQ